MNTDGDRKIGKLAALVSILVALCLLSFDIELVLAEANAPIHCEDTFDQTTHGTILFAHGLNQNPAALSPLKTALRKRGYRTCQLRLLGHEVDDESIYRIDKELWLKQLKHSHQSLINAYPESPLFMLGYSLSAALTVRHLDLNPSLHFDAMVFLAPSFSLTKKSILLRLLIPLRFFNLALPSYAPKSYRVHSKTPLSAYHAALELTEDIQRLVHAESLNTTPCLIFANERDELISFSGIESWLRKNKLDDWKLQPILRLPEQEDLPEHIIVDKASLGQKAWTNLVEKVAVFFAERH